MDAAALEESACRALVPAPGHERVVKRGFWRKIRATLGKLPLADRVVAAYFAALDPTTPAHAKAILLAALAYFIVPVDLVPDFLTGIGFSDDATVFLMAAQALGANITDAHLEKARAALRDIAEG